jgi:hypothetical protein
MTVAIMQPTYLPWAGYFNLIARASRFVVLNDVQFAKPSWQMRNRILLQGQVQFITVPTLGSRNQLISEVRLAPEDFRSKHRRMLEHAYGKHPHGPAMLQVVLPVLEDRSLETLQALNVALIRALCAGLGIEANLTWASQLAPEGQRSARLLSILGKLGEKQYLSPPGSADYIAEDGLLEAAGIAVEYQHFEPHPYPQRGVAQFEPRLSIVDVVASLGFEGARAYVMQASAPSSLAEPGARPHPPETREPEPTASPPAPAPATAPQAAR